MESIKLQLKKFEETPPEIVFEWHDKETEAKGWVVINSLRGGSAGGGTRMRKGLDRNEVLSLAKTMEIKFSISGPPIGGAKSGIDFDPNDPRKKGVLQRWFRDVLPLLKAYYGTGGDLNVDEINEVIPFTSKLGLHHPQEGTAAGHFGREEPGLSNRISNLQKGVSKIVTDERYTPDADDKFLVADLITGWGVAEAVKHYYKIWHQTDLEGKRCIIQGWGNVASSAGYYLAKSGAKIVGILDRHEGIIKPEGMGLEDTTRLFYEKKENTLQADELISFEEADKIIWDIPADIFIPGAASRLVSISNLERLREAGLEVISCGANVPFRDSEIFYGPVAEYADNNFAVIPDFIANCGMARTFAYLMTDDAILTDEAIFEDVSALIHDVLKEIYLRNQDTYLLTGTSYKVALDRIINSTVLV